MLSTVRLWALCLVCLSYFACQGGGPPAPTSLGVSETPLTIHDASQLIGGSVAQGRVGDLLLKNDQIRVVIQKPMKNAGIGSFGGTILDVDHVRSDGGKDNDQWGELFPMVNIEWTVNYTNLSVATEENETQIITAQGMIDTYDYLDLDWIAEAAKATIGQEIGFADRFDDRSQPFELDKELKDLSPEVTTEYRLEPGANYVQIKTTFNNPSAHDISLPVGDFLVGSGELELLVPGIGFSPPPAAQIERNTPGVIYAALGDSDISYGYFYDPAELKFLKTNSISYAGLTGVMLGEEFLKILPIGAHTPPEIRFVVPAEATRTITRYFVVGDGSAGSVLDTALKILKVKTARISGQVVTADGTPISGATVAIKMLGGATLVTYRSDAGGNFSGLVPTGEGEMGKTFAEGKYEVWVDKKGYHENGAVRAGRCNPAEIDLTAAQSAQLLCTLGQRGVVTLAGGVKDGTTGAMIPSRLTIVGEDPSPDTKGVGTFHDLDVNKRPFGVVDSLLINAKGGIGLLDGNQFDLEPGEYLFVFSHGPEYSIVEKSVTVPANGTVTVDGITLQHVIATPGFVTADFHIHALPSPDSAVSVERRTLAAVADGLDVLHSSDHDFLTDYSPVVTALSEQGVLTYDSIQTIVGDEITPNHFGHLHAFPLEVNLDDPDHGALDWSLTPLDEISPAPDYVLTPSQIVAEALKDPGEEVIQVNHISDNPTGLLVASGWLTTPAFLKDFKIGPFVSFADPADRRLVPVSGKAPFPPYGPETSGLIFDQFSAVELVIGPNMKGNLLWESAFPTWFNLLNLGLTPTATGNSDSHHEVNTPLGIPRNFVAMDVDPRDGLGDSFAAIDPEIYAHHINEHKVVVSAGPFILLKASNPEGEEVGVGGTLHGKEVALDVVVEAPDWAWFDTIEIFINTEPVPAEDSGRFALRDEASNPYDFAQPYHVPHYVCEPTQRFRLVDKTLEDWVQKDGKIRAHLKLNVTLKEDSWIVVVAKGTKETEGYRSLFPLVPDVLLDPEKPPADFAPNALSDFHRAKNVGAPAWAFTNPIFIDTDGDTDGDGNPFEAKWVRLGISKLKPFRQ